MAYPKETLIQSNGRKKLEVNGTTGVKNPKPNGKRVLVTGGAGFIGSHVTDACIATGYDVAVVDNLSTGRMANLNPAARFYQIDIRSDDLDAVFRQEKPHIVNHHAAQMSVPDSVRDPKFDADVNVLGFLNLMECAIRHQVKKTIFISSGGAIYGETDIYPTPETCPPQPLSPYAVTKLIAEHYLQFYRHQYGMDYTVLRYANIYGPRQIPKGEAGVVAIFIENLLAGRPSVVNAYPDEPRGMERDYCYVEDVARANILAMAPTAPRVTPWASLTSARASPRKPRIYTTSSTKHMQLLIPEKPGADPDPSLATPRREPARKGDLTRSCLDIEKTRSVIGWKPSIPLVGGIHKTVSWYRTGR
jgi:UDP-glucose 4-epimerase